MTFSEVKHIADQLAALGFSAKETAPLSAWSLFSEVEQVLLTALWEARLAAPRPEPAYPSVIADPLPTILLMGPAQRAAIKAQVRRALPKLFPPPKKKRA